MERDLIAADSVPVLERPEEDAPLVTELIAGERLVVMEDAEAGSGSSYPGTPPDSTRGATLDGRARAGWWMLPGRTRFS